MKKGELATILEKHGKWLAGDAVGQKANLHEADLHGANLRWADLREADQAAVIRALGCKL